MFHEININKPYNLRESHWWKSPHSAQECDLRWRDQRACEALKRPTSGCPRCKLRWIIMHQPQHALCLGILLRYYLEDERTSGDKKNSKSSASPWSRASENHQISSACDSIPISHGWTVQPPNCLVKSGFPMKVVESPWRGRCPGEVDEVAVDTVVDEATPGSCDPSKFGEMTS